jgi:hypothetical protein
MSTKAGFSCPFERPGVVGFELRPHVHVLGVLRQALEIKSNYAFVGMRCS